MPKGKSLSPATIKTISEALEFNINTRGRDGGAVSDLKPLFAAQIELDAFAQPAPVKPGKPAKPAAMPAKGPK